MLNLTIKGKSIPLPRNFSMRLTIRTPWFQFEKIPHSYSLDFSLPVNEYTSAIFAHPERVTRRRMETDQRYTDFKVTFRGALLLSGSLTLSITGKTYNCSAVDVVGQLSEATRERSILDIGKFSGEMDFVHSTDYNPDIHPYCCFPVINGGFFRDKGVKAIRTVWETVPGEGLKKTDETYETEVLTYCFNKSAMSRVNALNADGTVMMLEDTINITNLHEKRNTYQNGKVSVVSPFFFLHYVIRETLKAHGLHIRHNFMLDNPELKNLCIYNNFDITQSSFITLADQIEFLKTWVNEWEMEGMPMDVSSAGSRILGYVRSYTGKLVPANHLPRMTAGDLLISTQNQFNLCFDFLPNAQVNVFSREELMGREAINLQKYLVGNLEPGAREYRALNFTRPVDEKDLVFAERFVDLDDRRKDIREPVDGWEELLAIPNPAEGEIRMLSSINKFCEYRWLTQSQDDRTTRSQDSMDVLGWEEISISLQNGWHRHGREEVKKIETSWGTCYSLWGSTLVNQQGDQSSWKSREQSFAPRLLIYGGNNSGGNEVPGLSLEYEKDGNGLLAKHWKKTARMLADALPITGYFDFPVNVLRSVIFNKCLPYRTDEASFFIDEISLDLYADHISTTEMKLYKRE